MIRRHLGRGPYYEAFLRSHGLTKNDRLYVDGWRREFYLIEPNGSRHVIFTDRDYRRYLANGLLSELDRQEEAIRQTKDRLARKRGSAPTVAEILLSYLLTPDRLEETLGDFAEGFDLMSTRHGIGHARRWYWWQLFMVAVRGAFDVACRAAKIWTGFGQA